MEQYWAYNKLLQKMSENKCYGCIKFNEHLSLIKEQKRHKEEVNALKFQMSDEALQQMPDFQGRVIKYYLSFFLFLSCLLDFFLLLLATPND